MVGVVVVRNRLGMSEMGLRQYTTTMDDLCQQDQCPQTKEDLLKGPDVLTALDSVSRPKDSREVPGFQLE